MSDRSIPVYSIELAGPIEAHADRLVDIRIDDPGRRLGDAPFIRMVRRDPRRWTPARGLLLDRWGRGRFLGWTPDDVAGIEVHGDTVGANPTAADPTIRFRRLSIAEMIAIALRRHPRGAWNVFRLFGCGNRKGAIFRFVRLFETIAAPSYAAWIEARDREDAAARPGLAVDVARWPSRPRVVVEIGDGPVAAVAATRASLEAQSHRDFQTVTAEEASAVPRRTDVLRMRVPAGVRLAPDALHHLVRPFAFDPAVVACYCDEDVVDRRGRRREPMFRTAWSRARAEDGGLSPTVVLVRADRFPPSGRASEPTGALFLFAAEAEGAVVAHVPRVLVHRPQAPARPRERLRAVPDLAADDRPAVSVVIPSRDRAELLEACLDGLLEGTAGVDLDVVIVDNGSVEPATADLYARLASDPRLRRLDRPGPFNFSRLVGDGVSAARNEMVLLLNNDVEAIEPNWLRAMVAELREPGVAAVGARLVFPDGHIQHAGVTIGAGGVARHTFYFYGSRCGEDAGWLELRRDVSSVTAACLLTRRSDWFAVGGMDTERLMVAFNDVDFCLKLRSMGKRVVWTPNATLIHRESVSRGAADTPEKRRRLIEEEVSMQERWGDRLISDPYHNPNTTLVGEMFVLDARPRDRVARLVP